MKVDVKELRDSVTHNLPNGSYALTDQNGVMLAYCKHPEKVNGNDWDWVRKDCQKK
jgi:hypothetical protein